MLAQIGNESVGVDVNFFRELFAASSFNRANFFGNGGVERLSVCLFRFKIFFGQRKLELSCGKFLHRLFICFD